MKLKATIEVEFEGDPNAPENALRAALTRRYPTRAELDIED